MKTLSKICAIATLLLFQAAGTDLHAQTPTNTPIPPQADPQEKRLALVIGNSNYAQKPVATAANDAGLVAQTLQAAGFDVIGARDLDGETLRKSLRDFIDKVGAAGPDAVALVYLSGYGMQLSGENYFVPIDAKIARDTDVPIDGLRISDYTRQLSALPLKAGIVVLDAARNNPFAKEGQPLAGGLALVEPEAKMLIAFNSAPGTIALDGAPPYGAYAQALCEMIRQGGLPLPDLFERVRLRVNEMTKGAQVPWDAEKLDTSFMFFERAPDAPAAAPPDQTAELRTKPIRDFDVKDAYIAALERDTLAGYEDFLAAFPNDPLAKRVRAIVAARREAITWRRTYRNDTAPGYWSYLRRYPNGPHAADARRRLTILAAALEPPPSFATITYDVPPPPPDEIVYVERPVLYYGDPVYDFAPPPPPPVFFLPPPPPDFVVLPPPPPPIGIFVLPRPLFVPIPVFVRPPVYVAPPPNNIIFNNIHNTTVINTVINNTTVNNTNVTINNPAPAGPSAGGPPAAAAVGPALPAAAAQKASLVQPQVGARGAGTTPASLPSGQTPPSANAAPGAAATAPAGHQLPGAAGQPLPKPNLATAPATGTPPTTNAKPGTGPAATANTVAAPNADSKPAAHVDDRLMAKPGALPATGLKPAPAATAAKPPSDNAPPGARPSQTAKLAAPAAQPSSAPPHPAIAHTPPPPHVAPAPPPRQVAHVEARRPPPPPPPPRPAPAPRPQQQAAHIERRPPPPPRPAPPPKPAPAKKCPPGKKC
jgi:uncharacterized caspase-like protein